MRIVVATPASARSRAGNRHTAQRYASFLRASGHRVQVATELDDAHCDLLIALHARRSFASIARYRAVHPSGPLVVVLTGTDLYRDIRTDASAQASLGMATLLIVLQERGIDELSARLRRKTRVVYQSADATGPAVPPRRKFRIAVLGHLREEKDPFRTAYAVQELSEIPDLEIVHLGDALSPALGDEARRLERLDRRYRWLGGLSHGRAVDWLRRSHILVVSSRIEGGANVICEAARIGVPVMASRIPGNIGMLGRGYPGMFTLQDTRSLARLIARARTDSAFYDRLRRATTARGRLFTPAAERRGLLSVVHEAVRLARSE
jgi:putative glycosyltransferase (TIGR04348 family)